MYDVEASRIIRSFVKSIVKYLDERRGVGQEDSGGVFSKENCIAYPDPLSKEATKENVLWGFDHTWARFAAAITLPKLEGSLLGE